jgi:hypothetical protein
MRFDVTRSVLLSSFAAGIVLLTACSGVGTDGTGTGNTGSTGIAGTWSTQSGAQTQMDVQLALSGTALSGTGTITVPPLAPSSGPATPAYTGDSFTITSGTFTTPNVSFTATLGANPDGSGGFYHGTLSFSGTQSGNSMTGTLTFTPPRTASQTFAAQTVTGMTLSQ